MMSALIEYNPTEAALADLRRRFGNVVFDISTTKGNKEARAARKELVGLRANLEAKRKALKAPAIERSRLIDAEAARIKCEIEALEEPIDAQIKADEARQETERQAKAEKSAQRIAGHQAALDALRGIAVRSVGDTAEELAKTIEMLDATEISADWEEFQPLAQRAKDYGIATLRGLQEKAAAVEAEVVRIAAGRAELAELAAAQAKRDREAAEQSAALKRQQEAESAAARAKIEAEQKVARDAIEAAECESRRKIEEQERAHRQAQEASETEARKLREAAEAVAKAARDAEEARQRAERKRLEDAQRAAEAAARKARDAEEARELALRREAERLQHGRDLLISFLNDYADDPEFAAIISVVRDFLQPSPL
jgi:hypothetical protein